MVCLKTLVFLCSCFVTNFMDLTKMMERHKEFPSFASKLIDLKTLKMLFSYFVLVYAPHLANSKGNFLAQKVLEYLCTIFVSR